MFLPTGPEVVDRLREAFRWHDLRHYFASLRIAGGAKVEVAQGRLRHAKALRTLNTYGHICTDTDESARTALGEVLAARADSLIKTRIDGL